ELSRAEGVLDVSVLLGFPYADVAEMGAAVLAVADGSRPRAEEEAHGLADWWWERRHAFASDLLGPADAVARSARLDGPVCLLDMGDNVGGGSPGDGTVLAWELHRAGVGPGFVCLYDPEAVRQASAAGVGARVALRAGGHTDRH